MSSIDLETCRICLETVSCENIFQIYDNTCKRLLEEIIEISGADFNGVFEQPWYVCMQCYTDLLTAQGFRKKCIESYKLQTINQTPEEVPQLVELLVGITEMPSEVLNEKDIIENEVLLCAHSDDSSKETNEEDTHKKQKLEKISQICEICGNIFPSKRNFALHLRRHTNNKPYECELCSNKFYTNAELKCHMRRHTGEKPYECKYCHRKFSDYGTHKKHERTHTNDRPYSCNFCEKAFTNAFILRNHILTHTGKRDFKCKVCDKSFIYLGHLTSHLKSMFHLRNCKKAEEEEEEDKEEK